MRPCQDRASVAPIWVRITKAVAEEVGTSRQTVEASGASASAPKASWVCTTNAGRESRALIEDDEVMVLLTARSLDTEPADGSTHWSCRSTADTTGVSKSTVQTASGKRSEYPTSYAENHFKLSRRGRSSSRSESTISCGSSTSTPRRQRDGALRRRDRARPRRWSEPSLCCTRLGSDTSEGVTHGYIRHGTTTGSSPPSTWPQCSDRWPSAEPRHRHQPVSELSQAH